MPIYASIVNVKISWHMFTIPNSRKFKNRKKKGQMRSLLRDQVGDKVLWSPEYQMSLLQVMSFDFSLTDVKRCTFFLPIVTATKHSSVFSHQSEQPFSPAATDTDRNFASHKTNGVTGLRCKHGFRKCMLDAKFAELTPDGRQTEHFQARWTLFISYTAIMNRAGTFSDGV